LPLNVRLRNRAEVVFFPADTPGDRSGREPKKLKSVWNGIRERLYRLVRA
jgi:hypothetical protein